MAVKGIDVSVFQGTINWEKVKKAGIEFAVLRGTYGRYEKDEKFELNYKNARAAGMPIGFYHYTYANTIEKAKQEADFVISVLKGKQFEYPIAFDIEDKSLTGLSRQLLTDITKTFCARVQAAGYYVNIYTNPNWTRNYLYMDQLKDFDVWIAQWSDKCTYSGEYGIWQYSEKGKVSGISGRVDMDYAYKDYPTIIKNAGLNGYKKETNPQPKPEPKKTIEEIAQEVIDGKWGDKTTKPSRKQRLEAAGYNYDEVQKLVTRILSKIHKKGDPVKVKNQPLYASATAKSATNKKTGTYYIYDGEKVNGRYRVTVSRAFCGKKPMSLFVSGWMEL